MTAMTMDHLTQGRVLLGIGTSNPQVVEGWYGQPYPRPLERTREYVDILRKVIAREEPVSYDGKHYQLPLARRNGPGQAAALDPAPVPHRDPRLPRRGGAAERGARGRDRRRVAPHVLLARDERLLRHGARRGLRPSRRPPLSRDLRRRRRPARHRPRRRPRARRRPPAARARPLHRRHGRPRPQLPLRGLRPDGLRGARPGRSRMPTWPGTRRAPSPRSRRGWWRTWP